MTLRSLLLLGAIASASFLAACDSNDPEDPPQIATTFSSSAEGWQGGYADYSAETEPDDVVAEIRSLPAPFSGTGYYMSGTNYSDDLFIYSKNQFGGYTPSSQYKLSFEIELVTDQPSDCVGVGGSPGESVWIVAGAAPTEPKIVLKDDRYTLNLDRGNQATPGPASQVLGNIANSVPDCGPRVYESKILKSTEPLTVTSDGNGNIWVFLGMDSGFEAKSTVFYNSLKVTVEAAL